MHLLLDKPSSLCHHSKHDHLLPLYRLGLDCYQPPPCFIINTKETMKFILTAVTLLASTAAVAAKEPKVLRGPVLVRYINSIVGLTIANEHTHHIHLTNILVSPLPYIKYRLKTEHPRVASSSPRKPRLLPPSSKMMSLLKQPRTRRRRFPSSSPLT